jgi:type I restriction enzyme R subunit
MTGFSEADWEQVALDTLGEHEWITKTGTQIPPGVDDGRESWADIVLPGRMLTKMRELNPGVPAEYLDQARAAILQPQSQDALAENYRLHHYLVGGYRPISYIDSDGIEQNPTIRLVSHRPDENEFLAVHQVTVRTKEHHRRFDMVLYLNGMPVAIFELKQAGAKHADVAGAHAQLQTYLSEFPCPFGSRCSQWSATASPPATALHSLRWSTSRRGTLTTTASL